LTRPRRPLKDLLTAQNRQITVDNIQKTVAEYYKIKVSDMHSKKRSRNVARPRQLAMALAKDLTQMSLPDIGDAFGNATIRPFCMRVVLSRRCERRTTILTATNHVLEQVLKGVNKLRATLKELWVNGLAGRSRLLTHVSTTACSALYQQLTNPEEPFLAWLCRVIQQEDRDHHHNKEIK